MKAETKHRNATQGGKKGWPEAYRLLATGALVAYSAIGSRVVIPAQAQSAPAPPAQTARASAEAGPRRFEIPAGPLAGVLEQISQATELRIRIATDGLRGVQSPGVSGIHAPRAAVEQALRGTGARVARQGDGTLLIELESVSETVEVVGAPAPSSPSTRPR